MMTTSGRVMRANTSSGGMKISATVSVRCSATAFGASSPSTTCRYVIARNASAIATPCATTALQGTGSARMSGVRSRATTGSPIQPKPRLASVTPSWVAAIVSSLCSIAQRTAAAA